MRIWLNSASLLQSAAIMSNVKDKIFGAFDREKNARIAQMDHLRRHTLAIWQEFPRKVPFMGSATCIQIADRLFVSTAAHNFEDIPCGGKFTLFSIASGVSAALRVIDQNYGGYGKTGTVDVAWLEVDPRSAAEEGIVGLSLDLVDAGHDLDFKTGGYAIVGLPPDFRRLSSDPTNPKSFPPVYYFVNPAKHAKPKDDSLFFHFAEKAIKDGVPVPMPDPGGFSGGGIWSSPWLQKNELWSPRKYRLIAVSTDFYEISRHVSGLPMHHWLSLVAQDHPELRQYLDSAL